LRFLFWGKKKPIEEELKELKTEQELIVREHRQQRKELVEEIRKNPKNQSLRDEMQRLDAFYMNKFKQLQKKIDRILNAKK